jgi:hypothetical protein
MARPQDKTSPVPSQTETDGQPETKSVKYVVVRDGHRVSDKEYDSSTDPDCLREIKFWKGISKSNSYGEKVSAVPYDSKKHRVFQMK